MAIKIGANFAYNGKLANFERDSFETKAAMKAFNENSIDEGHLSYCKEDGKTYQYKSSNSVDTVTGRWRVFKTDIVVDAELNGTSTNAIQNKAVFKALEAKANNETFAYYQLKYNANYVAKGNLDKLPINEGIIDLNGYTLTMSDVDNADGELTIINGVIKFPPAPKPVKIITSALTFHNITFIETAESHGVITLSVNILNLINVISDGDGFNTTNGDIGPNTINVYNSIIDDTISVKENIIIYNSSVKLAANNAITVYADNSTIFDDGYNYAIGSAWHNCYEEITGYISGYTDTKGSHNDAGYEISLNNTETNAPQTKAVYDALQLKADKTQLGNYLAKTDASITYATKDSLNNEVNQLVEEINLKLDDTVAASTYLRQDDANTTYAKKTDITNIYKFKGTKTNYSDLPTTGVIAGDVWNITNADAEHGIKAGDNVAWNGTAWDNLSGVTDLSGYATTTTTDAMSADIKKLMDKAFPFTVKVSLDKTLAKKGTSQAVKVTITPKIGDDNTNVDEIMINGAEYHGATPYVHSDTATATTTYNVRVRKDDRTAQGSATITFVNPSYDGAVAANFTVTEASIKALTEAVRSGKGGTRTFNLNNQKACIAYPKTFGAATSIKDANGFDYLASYTRSELNVNGELYYVYLLTNATTITDMKQTVS
nr:MAG TPA: hypothetical protein [Crassvirales sp.]